MTGFGVDSWLTFLALISLAVRCFDQTDAWSLDGLLTRE
jgi:hypothetical protein